MPDINDEVMPDGPKPDTPAPEEKPDTPAPEEKPDDKEKKKKKNEPDGGGWIPDDASWEGWDKLLDKEEKENEKEKGTRKSSNSTQSFHVEEEYALEDEPETQSGQANYTLMDADEYHAKVDKILSPYETYLEVTAPDGYEMEMSAMTDATSARDDVVSEMGDYAAEATAEAEKVVEASVEKVAEVGMTLGGV